MKDGCKQLYTNAAELWMVGDYRYVYNPNEVFILIM